MVLLLYRASGQVISSGGAAADLAGEALTCTRTSCRPALAGASTQMSYRSGARPFAAPLQLPGKDECIHTVAAPAAGGATDSQI